MTQPAERDPSLMLWLIGGISRWVKTAEQPVQLAETIVDGLTAAGVLVPAAVGRCGKACPVQMTHAPRPVCALPAGHAGWHRADDGCEWGEINAEEPA